MLRGALDIVTETYVSGWMYSELASLRGKVVLAFHGAKCIGSGEIGKPRPDLVQAGLGDGQLGFEFPIVSPGESRLLEVYVRLTNSEAVFLQKDSRVVAAATPRGAAPVRRASREDAGDPEYDVD